MASKNRNLQLAALLTAIAVLVALGWRMLAERGAPELVAPPIQEAPAPARVLSNDDQLASDAAGTARRVVAEAGEARAVSAANHLPLDGRRWRDLVVLFDVLDDSPIDEAALVHFAASGQRRSTRLDDLVLEHDLDHGALVVLDHDAYCPRFVDASLLAAPSDGPRPVSLHPAGSLRIELEDPSIALPVAQTFTIEDPRLREDPEALDPHLEAQDLDVDRQLHPIKWACRRQRELLERDNGDAWRATSIAKLIGNEVLAPLFQLDGPPVVGGWALVELETSTLPVTIGDLPVGAHLDIEHDHADIDEIHVFIAVADAQPLDDWSDYASLTISADSQSLFTLLVRVWPLATLSGQLPTGAREAELVVVRWHANDGDEVSGRPQIGASGRFVCADLMPGTYSVVCDWLEPSGESARVERLVELLPGADVDLGLLTLVVGPLLTVVPRVYVNGALDESDLDGALTDATWNIRLRRTDLRTTHDGLQVSAIERQVNCRGLAPFTISSNEYVHYEVEVDRFALPDGIVEHARVMRWLYNFDLDLTRGDQTIEVPFEIESTFECEIVLNIPPASAGRSRSVRARACQPETGKQVVLHFASDVTSVLNMPWRCTAHVGLPRGRWVVLAVANTSRTETDGANGPEDYLDHVGRAELMVTGDTPTRLEIELGRAARVHAQLTEGAYAHMHWLYQLQLVEALCGAGDLWSVRRLSDQSVEAYGLLPNTEYVVVGLGKHFTTGAAGTTIELND